jgi:hypothetical protein
MGDEHDDDAEPEVNEGAEVETQNYVDVTEDLDDGEPVAEHDEPGPADEDGLVEDEASDTI